MYRSGGCHPYTVSCMSYPHLLAELDLGFTRLRNHRPLTDTVHAEGGKIALRILHSGRYGHQPFVVSASAIQTPISKFKPRAPGIAGIGKTVRDDAPRPTGSPPVPVTRRASCGNRTRKTAPRWPESRSSRPPCNP